MRINYKGFTLIEIIIVISIIGIMMTMVYTPYNLFQRKAEVRIASKSISKTISESRNMAIHGVASSSGNLSIGVYFDKDNKNIIQVFSYPYQYGTGNKIVVDDLSLLSNEIDLGKNIWIEKIAGKTKVLFFFEAISGEGYYFDFENTKNDLLIPNNKIEIEFSYKGALKFLRNKLEFYTKTYIIDY